MKSIDIALGSVLTALAITIPFAFRGTLQIYIPSIGYSATLGSHVPVMLSTILGPVIAGFVGVGSTLGFLATLGPLIAARASTHILWGMSTAFAIKKGMSYPKALFLVALPLHAITEGLVVMPFGIPLEGAFLVMIGTAIHHTADSIISIIILAAARPLLRSLNLPWSGGKEKSG